MSKTPQAFSLTVTRAIRLGIYGIRNWLKKSSKYEGVVNGAQECARRRRFHASHFTAIGGDLIWSP